MFPIGVVLGMIAMAAKGLANVVGHVADDGGTAAGGIALAVLLFPALGGLTARGRNGYARILLIVALAFAYIAGYAPLTIALFAGYLAMSFAISDLGRTTRELAWGAAALVLLSPLIPAFAPTVAAWIFDVKLATLPPPYASLSVAADIFTHDKLRLLIGHGFGRCPAAFTTRFCRSIRRARSPSRSGTSSASSAPSSPRPASGSAFTIIGKAPPRLAPFMIAGFAAIVALAFSNVDFDDMTALTLIGVAVISADVAARSQYRTTRPSAASLANL